MALISISIFSGVVQAGQSVQETIQIEIPRWAIPVVQDVQQFISVTSWLVGGLFGLYLIYLIFQLRYWYKFNKTINEMKNDIKDVKAKLQVLESSKSGPRKHA